MGGVEKFSGGGGVEKFSGGGGGVKKFSGGGWLGNFRGVEKLKYKWPPKFSDFFLKSEGKEIEKKERKRVLGGGGVGYFFTYFQGLIFFEWGAISCKKLNI